MPHQSNRRGMGSCKETLSVNIYSTSQMTTALKITCIVSLSFCFSNINGTSASNFEGHLAEIIWRNHHAKTSRHVALYSMITENYPLDRPATYHHTTPIFEWNTTDMTILADDERKCYKTTIIHR